MFPTGRRNGQRQRDLRRAGLIPPMGGAPASASTPGSAAATATAAVAVAGGSAAAAIFYIYRVVSVAILAQAFFCQQIWRPRPAPAMGSLGWARCYWCGEWEEGMYIIDGVDHPLCELCSDRWEPPQPDARARLAKELECIFPARVAWEIAELTHHWHEP